MTGGAEGPGGRDVGIVGGGLLGLTMAYRLARAGLAVTVYERAPRLGGLAGSTVLGGHRVDRFYHAVLPTDTNVMRLAGELGLGDRFRMRRTGVGFYHDGRLASMNTPLELLRFPGLSPADRMWLVAFVARCRLVEDFRELDDVPLERWVRRASGDRMWERLWRPLLDSKFDGRHADLPATYLWSRTRRTAGTRDRSGREVMGWLRGGYQSLVDALARAIRRHGGEIRTSTPVRFVPSKEGRALGVVLDTGFRAHDWTVTTLLRPNMVRLLSPELEAAVGPDSCRYLGVVCLVARVRRSVSPYYALNLTDRRVPITSIVETTHVVDPEHVGGTLLYVPRYVDPGNPELERSSAEIEHEYLEHVRTIFPRFSPADVIASQVARARFAEPVHVAGPRPRRLGPHLAPGLLVTSAADVYPDIVHGHAVIGAADRAAGALLERLPRLDLRQRSAA